MPNTDTWWDLNGVSLHEFAWSIESIGGDLSGAPSTRGSNIQIPGRPGTVFQAKQFDERILSLGMFVIGAYADGVPALDVRAMYDANYARLRRMFVATARKPGTLTKRFIDETGQMRTASAKVEYAGGLSPRMDGRARSTFQVDLRLADPFFYSAVKTKNLVAGVNTLDYSGDAPTQRIKFLLTGARLGTTFWNRGLGINVQTVDSIASGSVLTIDVNEYTAKVQAGSNPAINAIGGIRHAGAAVWFEIDQDNKQIEVITSGGAGAMTAQYQEAWL